jgi:hypothetical protein
LADQFIVGVAPIDYGPILLLKPFGFHLTMDTLPSGLLLNGGFRSALICFQLSLSCPFRLLHTFPSLRPARHYPRLWIRRSSSERRRDLNPHEQRAAQHTLCELLTQDTSLVLMQSLERTSANLFGWSLIWYFYIRRAFRIYPLSVCLILLSIALSIPPDALGVCYSWQGMRWA